MSKFEQLMDKIRKSHDGARQLREELERKLADLQSEVTSAQEVKELPKSWLRAGSEDIKVLLPVSAEGA